MKKAISLLTLLAAFAISAAAQTTATQCTADTSAPSVLLTSGLATTTYTDSAVVNGSTYAYIVTAVDMAGNACSNVSNIVTIPSSGSNTVALSWNASTTSGVTYSVYRAPQPIAPSGLAATVN